MLSGRQFPGACKDIVRPCARDLSADSFRYAGGTYGSRAVCSCQAGPSCGCPRPDGITLGGYPLNTINEVLVADDSNPAWDGGVGTAVLDSSLYRIDDWRHLIRKRNPDGSNPGWPCCQPMDIDPPEAGTFQVTFEYGKPPPRAGVKAAAVLGCQLALACNPEHAGQCQLPRRVQQVTREGVSMVLGDLTATLAEGRTGLTEVDFFLVAYNPNGLDRPAGVLSPDIGRRVTRAGT